MMTTEEIENVLLSIYGPEPATKALAAIEGMMGGSSEMVGSVGFDCLQNHLDECPKKIKLSGSCEGLGYLAVTKDSDVMWVGWLKRKLRDFLNHGVALEPPIPELDRLHSIIAVEWINDNEFKFSCCDIKIILF